MLSFSGSLKVFVAVEACDIRKSFNGLHALVTERLGEDLKQGALFVFSNRRHTRIKIICWDGTGIWVLNREGFALRLDLVVRKAEQTCPSLRGRRITPHTWRHSTAMHLLQAGVPLEVIALWLGHEQPAVTHTYEQADIKMKQECMKLLEQPGTPRRKRNPMRFSRLLSFLEAQ